MTPKNNEKKNDINLINCDISAIVVIVLVSMVFVE